MSDAVLSERQGAVATITLNRPERLNAINRPLIDRLDEALAAAEDDPGVRAIVLTGAGRAFCAGDDLVDEEQHDMADETTVREFVEALQDVTRRIVLGRTIVVGAIHGWAVGGGFEWAINCDFPIWAEGARGFFPEMQLGLFVTGGVTRLLPALVGPVKAKEMILLGEHQGARGLKELGLAWKVVPETRLMDEALALAERLVALPPLAAGEFKRIMGLAPFATIEEALALEIEACVATVRDPDTRRRIAAFSQG